MKRALLIVGLALLSLTLILACGKPEEPAKAAKPAAEKKAAAEKPAAGPQVLVFQCKGGQGFSVSIDQQADSALLKMNGKSIKLPHVPSGSGAKYSDGQTTLWMKGDEAFVEVGGKIIMEDCKIKK